MLAAAFFWFEDVAAGWFTQLGAPWWLTGFLWHGVYRGLAWVVSVMLPPMAIGLVQSTIVLVVTRVWFDVPLIGSNYNFSDTPVDDTRPPPFLGEHTEYLVRNPHLGPFLVLASRQAEAGTHNFEPGETGYASWREGAALILSKD